MGLLHTAREADIVAGKTTDAYFERTVRILRRRNIHRRVTVEVRAGSLPNGWSWAVLAGVDEALRLLAALKRKLDVECAPEGSVFHASDPVMQIAGDYVDFCVYETPLLGLLCQASGIATTAARCRIAVGDKELLSFGARRMHPAIAPMIERAAFIGGCDGVACIAGARLIREPARGTMPHALVLCFGDTVEATRAFHDIVGGRKISTVSLVDTINDEKFEAIRVAEALGKELAAIRVDTPTSRRGDLVRLLREIRWELDLRGHQHVKIFVSGGLDEPKLRELRDAADGFGVGTHISNAPTVDFALDIVEMDGRPLAKRGKRSGAKVWWQNRDTLESIVQPRAASRCPGKKWDALLQLVLRTGKLSTKLPTPQEIRVRVLHQLSKLGPE
ncbi:MAG TPA: nicotinate phosphoribosyltransferase [Verrucomicrobiae bacterium]|nr:nicotinate phosphoribosyltransferase [Verrucomicrobiae bacterium]